MDGNEVFTTLTPNLINYNRGGSNTASYDIKTTSVTEHSSAHSKDIEFQIKVNLTNIYTKLKELILKDF